MSEEFLQHHANAVNVFLHMLTTPVGLVGAVSILRWCTASTPMAAYIVLLYLLSLLPALTNGVYIGTAIMCACIVYTTRAFKLSLAASVALIIVAYALQDLAHMGVGEETLQSAYSGKNKHVRCNSIIAFGMSTIFIFVYIVCFLSSRFVCLESFTLLITFFR